MTTIYRQKFIYTFFSSLLLVIPTIVSFLTYNYNAGISLIILIILLISVQSAIKFDNSKFVLIECIGYNFLYIIKRKTNLNQIEGFRKTSVKIGSSYSLPKGSYGTSVKYYKLILKINGKIFTFFTGKEKYVDRIIHLIEEHKSKNI